MLQDKNRRKKLASHLPCVLLTSYTRVVTVVGHTVSLLNKLYELCANVLALDFSRTTGRTRQGPHQLLSLNLSLIQANQAMINTSPIGSFRVVWIFEDFLFYFQSNNPTMSQPFPVIFVFATIVLSL